MKSQHFHNQDITYLKEGEYVKATIKLEIGSRIRVPNAFEVAPFHVNLRHIKVNY